MEHSINTSDAIIMLGDRETVDRGDLVDTAAEHGAVIAESYGFEPGQAVALDNISEVEAVVTAISRAIATRTDVWVPFPFPDFGREQHIRRISLVLQRHGLNMLVGHTLEAVPTEGGYSAVDFALRDEVRSVDELDRAAVCSAGVQSLVADIERELNNPGGPARAPGAVSQVGERFYSTGEVARFFGKSAQWVYWGLREGVFTDPDGVPIEPIRIGKGGRRRFTLPVLREMARACYRRGIVSEPELLDLLAALACEQADD